MKYNPYLVLFLFELNDFEETQMAWELYNQTVKNYHSLLERPILSREDELEVWIELYSELEQISKREDYKSLHARIFLTLEDLSGLGTLGKFPVIFAVHSAWDNQRILLESASDDLNFTLLFPDIEGHPNYNPLKMTIHPIDGHPSAILNRIMAELIAGQLDDMGLFE